MQVNISAINFYGMPEKYSIIDNFVSRSAQPQKDDFAWLKSQGVTDIINFRTMYKPDINFDEEKVIKELGLKYHSIPSITAEPKEENIDLFMKEIEEIKKNGGKAHIHCKAGVDRTGMYAFLYKSLNNIGTFVGNLKEWIEMGHNYIRYPNLMKWSVVFLNNKKI